MSRVHLSPRARRGHGAMVRWPECEAGEGGSRREPDGSNDTTNSGATNARGIRGAVRGGEGGAAAVLLRGVRVLALVCVEAVPQGAELWRRCGGLPQAAGAGDSARRAVAGAAAVLGGDAGGRRAGGAECARIAAGRFGVTRSAPARTLLSPGRAIGFSQASAAAVPPYSGPWLGNRWRVWDGVIVAAVAAAIAFGGGNLGAAAQERPQQPIVCGGEMWRAAPRPRRRRPHLRAR